MPTPIRTIEEETCKCNCFCNFSNEHRHFAMRECPHCYGNGNKKTVPKTEPIRTIEEIIDKLNKLSFYSLPHGMNIVYGSEYFRDKETKIENVRTWRGEAINLEEIIRDVAKASREEGYKEGYEKAKENYAPALSQYQNSLRED
jgi:hypothetical protein